MKSDKPLEAAEVLIVDDDRVLRTLIQRILENQNFRITTASSAEEALTVLSDRSFDLVLTDLQMPGMSGLELLAHIKSRWPDLPVVMITAHNVAENVIQALRSGVSDFIPKPFKNDELLAIVEREAARGRIVRQLSSQPSAAPAVIGRQLTIQQYHQIDSILAELRAEASARCVLLVESTGHVIDTKGAIDDLNISALAALMAGDFAATSGIASLIGEGESFRLNYHEGERYSIYSAHLTRDVFILVVFGQEVKSGMVLYVTRHALQQLQAILEQADQASLADLSADQTLGFEQELLSTEVIDSLAEQFKNLWH